MTINGTSKYNKLIIMIPSLKPNNVVLVEKNNLQNYYMYSSTYVFHQIGLLSYLEMYFGALKAPFELALIITWDLCSAKQHTLTAPQEKNHRSPCE